MGESTWRMADLNRRSRPTLAMNSERASSGSMGSRWRLARAVVRAGPAHHAGLLVRGRGRGVKSRVSSLVAMPHPPAANSIHQTMLHRVPRPNRGSRRTHVEPVLLAEGHERGSRHAPRVAVAVNVQILHWKVGPGGTASYAVEQHMGSVMQAAGVRLYATMKLSCASLASDIGTAQGGHPSHTRPSAVVRHAWAGLSNAAEDCGNAISEHPSDETVAVHVNQALLNQAAWSSPPCPRSSTGPRAQIQSAHC